jgi:trigger factor
MKTTLKKLPNCIYEVTLEDTPKEYESCRKLAIAKISKEIQVKGFRKWATIPEAIVIKEAGESTIADETLDLYLKKNYSKVLEQTKLVPVAPGSVTNIVSYDPLVIVLQIEVLPEVTLDEKAINKIKIKKTEVTEDPKDTDMAIADIEKRFTHFHDSTGNHADGFQANNSDVEMGDRVTLNTQGYEKKGGAAIAETKVMEFPLVIGSGQFIPGFEEKLVGHKSGETVEFDITFPKDYHSEAFKWRKVYFVTELTRIEKPHRPEWTPEFIEQLRGVKTDMAGFREIIAKEILTDKERRAREVDEKQLLDELNKHATYELGASLVAREIESVFQEQKQTMESQGYQMKTYLDHIKKDEESYKAEVIAPEARRRVSAELILKKLRELKNIEASHDEIQMEINGIIAQYQNPEVIARLRAKLVPGDGYYEDIRVRLAYRKVVDGFFTTK